MELSAGSQVHGLRQAELVILKGFAQGLMYKEIAQQLHLSQARVKKLQHTLFKKLGVRKQAEAVYKWLIK
jgi:DNA-binding NarL/FixJ family response regulator